MFVCNINQYKMLDQSLAVFLHIMPSLEPTGISPIVLDQMFREASSQPDGRLRIAEKVFITTLSIDTCTCPKTARGFAVSLLVNCWAVQPNAS